jgi:hypothetical protein
MRKYNLILLIAFALALPSILFAQQTVTTAGGNGNGTGGSVNYTVGQVTNKLLNNGNHSVSEGVQQPYEISTETGIELKDININIKAFPNPADDFLTININDLKSTNFSYKLYRINGKLISKGKIETTETKINLINLSPAVYILQITDSGQNVKIFKIVKN